jgi:hypothetical protein
MIDLAVITPPETFPALAPEAVFKAWTALRMDFIGTADRPVVRAVTVTDLHAGTRKCRDCGLIKPLDAFTRNKTQAMGHTYQCKPCRNQMRKEHRMDARAERGLPPAPTRTVRSRNGSRQRNHCQPSVRSSQFMSC